jgi:hypothetical protein
MLLYPRYIPSNIWRFFQEAQMILSGAHKRCTPKQTTLHYLSDRTTSTSLPWYALRGFSTRTQSYGNAPSKILSCPLGFR